MVPVSLAPRAAGSGNQKKSALLRHTAKRSRRLVRPMPTSQRSKSCRNFWRAPVRGELRRSPPSRSIRAGWSAGSERTEESCTRPGEGKPSDSIGPWLDVSMAGDACEGDAARTADGATLELASQQEVPHEARVAGGCVCTTGRGKGPSVGLPGASGGASASKPRAISAAAAPILATATASAATWPCTCPCSGRSPVLCLRSSGPRPERSERSGSSSSVGGVVVVDGSTDEGRPGVVARSRRKQGPTGARKAVAVPRPPARATRTEAAQAPARLSVSSRALGRQGAN